MGRHCRIDSKGNSMGKTIVQNLKQADTPKKKRYIWEDYCADLKVEYAQSWDEGKDVENLKPLLDAISALPEGETRDELGDILFRMISAAPLREGYPYEEPDEYSEILALCQKRDVSGLHMPDDSLLRKKIRGAWVGRVCGCLLGKPIEGLKRDRLQRLLREIENIPMTRYIRYGELNDRICADCEYPYRRRTDFIDRLTDYSVSDDDTNYTAMAMKLVDYYGREFTSKDVRTLWLDMQPKKAYCTAERVAYINFVNGYEPPQSATYKNPFREYIGAQIRGDYFGFINPCDPTAAAEMAWRDAEISHVKNGIYGEMFVAAMLAAAASRDTLSMKEIILYGLGEIPATSRLYEALCGVLNRYDGGASLEAQIDELLRIYDDRRGYHWCHVISNAMIVTIALLYGNGDYSKSICLASEVGFDTDCNSATVGSVVGMRNGIEGISPVWYESIGIGFETSIFGCERLTYDEVTETTMKHIRMKQESKNGEKNISV